MLDPTSIFACPSDVCDEQSLSRGQKIKILRRWEYDARELQVAEEENMGGGPQVDEIEFLQYLQKYLKLTGWKEKLDKETDH